MYQILYKVFLDYDNVPLEKVKREVKMLQEKYNLGTAIIKRTNRKKENYHVIFEKPVESQQKVVEIIKRTSVCPKFLECAEKLGLSVLRLAPSEYKDPIELVEVMSCP